MRRVNRVLNRLVVDEGLPAWGEGGIKHIRCSCFSIRMLVRYSVSVLFLASVYLV